MKRSPPVIGITLDSEPAGGYAKLPWYALRRNYCETVAAVGGLPIPLPHALELVPAYLAMLDGLIVTGGAFDIDPQLYGATERHGTVSLKEQRTRFEWAMTEQALARDLPVLGVCGGQQLLNVVLGGTLIQHIPDSVSGCLAHEQPNPRTEAGHDVRVLEGSLLHKLTGALSLSVNSAHHQAAERVGRGIVESAHAVDGVIEAIEAPERRFCLGVQWHPEYLISDADGRIIKGLIEAAGA